MGSFSTRRDPLEEVEETEKERLQRRERGEVPARFGGTKEQGVRNTMSRVAPQGSAPSGMGSFRRGVDPLDRMGSKGGDAPGGGAGGNMGGGRAGDGDRMRQERVAAMDKPRAVAPGAAAGGAK
jgi:ubiquitin-like protein 5